MRWKPLALAAVALAAAVFAALLASDLRSWQSTVRAGDLRFGQDPQGASWKASTILPAGLSRGILGISDQLAFRRATRAFVRVDALGNGVDNGYSESRARGDLEVVLTELAGGSDYRRDSALDNLLGILAYSDSQQTGTSTPAPVDRAVGEFQSAVQLDPTNEAAKFNLEWLVNELVAHGHRFGQSANSSAGGKGHHGAGGSSPGHGY